MQQLLRHLLSYPIFTKTINSALSIDNTKKKTERSEINDDLQSRNLLLENSFTLEK